MAALINERYEILELVGIGGEGRVVKALDRRHDRLVTLKIRPVRDCQAREELLSEARILLAVRPHPALPLVREDFFDGDDYVLAMDWVEGTDLATLLRDRGRPGLAPSSVLAYLSQAAEALAHLHAQAPPVIHGDVKPANLILTTGGRVKLVDFGISSAPSALRRRLGTPGYRAPELGADGAPSRACDIYGLAATAFALLTGSAPAGVLPAWEGIDPAQAEQLETAIRLGMATDPARRPATPGELVERLRAGWAEALPTGVMTFCVSDIEDSPSLWDAHPAAMAEALVRHDELIAECLERHGGRFLKSIRESTVSVFDSASDALIATVAATRALSAERWPEDLPIAVRFGIHTGEAERRGTEYLGPAVNLAGQVRDQADGGQIFLSSVTTELVAAHLPEDCQLIDLGPHRLRALGKPEQVRAVKAPGITAPLAATECPYRGLLAFEPEDRAYFFGREAVVRELIERLRPGGLVAVVGASGSGKSSVLRAGLIAAVRAGEVGAIERAELLTPAGSSRLDVKDDPAQLVVVDQFEELLTLREDPARRQAFIDALLAVRGAVVIGVRADMYGKLASHVQLARAVAANQVLLGAMSEHELERAVTEPAHLAGLRLEPGLVQLAVREVAGEPGALPLLSHALRATWERRDGRTLTVDAYRATGGVGSAIAHTADSVVASLAPQHRQIARSVFLRLTELGDGAAETRRRVSIEELVPAGVSLEAVETLLERLTEARLVTLGEGTAEVAHEVLVREWPTLRGWLEEDREGIRLHRQLGAAARIWTTGGKDSSDLYRGARLSAAGEWAEHHPAELNATERRFLDVSLQEADRERGTQLLANRRLRSLLAGALALLLIAVVAGVVALIQRSHAQAQALTSDAERLGAEALSDPIADQSLLLAVTGLELQDRLQTRSDLFADLQQNAALIRLIRPSNVEITALDVSPNGRLLAVGDSSGTVRFIDLSTWKPTGSVVRLANPVGELSMSFSPNGHTLLTVAIGTDRSELDAIDVSSRKVRRMLTWRGLAGEETAAYSPNGREVAVTEDDDPGNGPIPHPRVARLVMLDASTGHVRWRRRYPLRSGQSDPYLTFSAAGALLTSAEQGDTLLWDPRTGRILRGFPLGGVPALSPNGRTVALGENSSSPHNQNSAIVVLDLHTGRHRALLANLPDYWIRSLAFTHDGSKIAGAATDGLHVWDLASGKIVESYVAGAGPGTLSTLDPSSDILISGQEDGSLAAFDLSGGRRLGRAFRWNSKQQGCGYSPCMAINHQSSLMATTQANGTVALVDLRTLRLVRTLPARDGPILAAVSFMPDGRTLVTGGDNHEVTFWSTDSGRVTRTLRFAEPVWWTAASPGGKLLAVQTGPLDGSSNRIELVRISTGAVLQSHPLPYAPGGVEFSRDGRALVALGCCGDSSGSQLIGWNARTGRPLFDRSAGLDAGAFDLAPDSRLLGVGTLGGQLLLLNPRTGKQVAPPVRVATGEVAEVSFSPDGRSVVVSSFDHTVSVWDVQSRTRLGDVFGPYQGKVPTVQFEPDGRLLINIASNAIEWPMDVGSWERFACQVAGRNLTRAEWREALPTRSYRRACQSNAGDSGR